MSDKAEKRRMDAQTEQPGNGFKLINYRLEQLEEKCRAYGGKISTIEGDIRVTGEQIKNLTDAATTLTRSVENLRKDTEQTTRQVIGRVAANTGVASIVSAVVFWLLRSVVS